MLHDSARVHAQPPGPEATLVASAPETGELADQKAVWSFVNSIGGGSDISQEELAQQMGDRGLGFSQVNRKANRAWGTLKERKPTTSTPNFSWSLRPA